MTSPPSNKLIRNRATDHYNTQNQRFEQNGKTAAKILRIFKTKDTTDHISNPNFSGKDSKETKTLFIKCYLGVSLPL